MNFDLIVYRSTMLTEAYGAYLWAENTNCKLMSTDAIVSMDSGQLNFIRNKSILIVGGYYRDHMDPILKATAKTTVFYNTSDNQESKSYDCIVAEENQGFLSWTIGKLSIDDPVIMRIGRYLDEYLYGYPSEDALCFQNGVYSITELTDIEKITRVRSMADVEERIRAGKVKRINNLRIAEQRFKCATQMTFSYEGQDITAVVGIGDSPIVDTCLLLSRYSDSGVGILFRYNLAAGRTLVSIRTTEESGLDAGKIASHLAGGGGSKPMGGGSLDGLKFPQDVIR